MDELRKALSSVMKKNPKEVEVPKEVIKEIPEDVLKKILK